MSLPAAEGARGAPLDVEGARESGHPYRVSAPPVEVPDTESDAYALRLRALTRRTRGIGALATLAAVGVCVTALAHARSPRAGRLPPLPATPRAAIAQIDDAYGRADVREARMRAALADAVASATPSASCTAEAHGIFGATPITRVDGGVGSLESAVVRRARADLSATRNALVAGTSRAGAASMAAASTWRAHEIVYVETTRTEPEARAGGTFVPGRAEGVAYVYDFARERVVCAARVESESSPQLPYRLNSTAASAPAHVDDGSTLQRALDEDLAKRTLAAVARATGV